MAANPVDEGLTVVERQALEFQAIARAYLTAPDYKVDQAVLDAVDAAIERLREDPKLAAMFRSWCP